ncbi:PadR family transcriptional regulator [Achromobacter sp. KS-M25]|nr:PadR family transcriptional regulator [Achromobacter aestuarii]
MSSLSGPSPSAALTRGRKFNAADLALMLLALLAEQEGPSHGYALINALNARSNGFYKPSPGTVYPALAALHADGLATVESAGSRKRYRLSDAGRAHLDVHREAADRLFAGLRHVSRKMAWMQRTLANQDMEVGAEGEDLATGWLPAFVQQRRALKQALFEASDACPDEQRRIAAILARAVAEIQQTG